MKITNIVENEEKVFCPLCTDKKTMKQITASHLKKHNLTIQEFKEQYPDCYLIHPQLQEKMIIARAKGKKRKEGTLVNKPCWNFKNCHNEVKVNINVGNKNITCDECRSRNLFHPDFIKQKERLSKQAQKLNKDPLIIDKRTKSLLNRTPEEIKSWKTKRENSLIEKDGENWKEIQLEKTKTGMFKTYGKQFALQVDEFKEQAQRTHFIKTGYIHYMNDPENVKKHFEDRDQDEITKRTIETNIKKYGGRSPMCNPSILDKANKTRLKKFLPKLYIFLEKVKLKLLDEYIDCYIYNKYQCLKCNAIFESNWNQIQQGRHCPSCNNKFKPSKGENEIYTYLQSIGLSNIIRSDRNLIKPYEIDILLPEQKICIEYCGLYTHRTDVLRKTRKKMNDIELYHSYKHDQCQKQGYQLLTIFEDEWLFKKDIVKSMLKHRMGKNNNIEQIYARKCEIFEINFRTKRDFLKKYHIQGNDISQIMLGAFDKKEDRLVAVMTFSKPSIAKGSGKQIKGHWELNRFCTDYNFRVPGIAGKLLSHFKKNFDWNYIYSFADRRWSSGQLYYQLGFTLITDPLKITPNYWYTKDGLVRIHRFTLRKTKDDPKDVTEKMLRVSQGYKIIHDCGNLKFTLNK